MRDILISASSQLGCVRSNNEDMILVSDRLVRNDIMNCRIRLTDTDRFVAAVADGMGGYKAGEVASEETLSNLSFFVGDLPVGLNSDSLKTLFDNWTDSINKILASKGSVDPKLTMMGTTLVSVVYYNGMFFWINSGDSRLYRWRNNALKQISVDHKPSYSSSCRETAGMVTNCIGAGSTSSYIDMTEFTDDIEAGDIYVLCSDGLSDMISDDDMNSIIISDGDADALCRAAVQAGGCDNVSVCMIKIV